MAHCQEIYFSVSRASLSGAQCRMPVHCVSCQWLEEAIECKTLQSRELSTMHQVQCKANLVNFARYPCLLGGRMPLCGFCRPQNSHCKHRFAIKLLCTATDRWQPNLCPYSTNSVYSMYQFDTVCMPLCLPICLVSQTKSLASEECSPKVLAVPTCNQRARRECKVQTNGKAASEGPRLSQKFADLPRFLIFFVSTFLQNKSRESSTCFSVCFDIHGTLFPWISLVKLMEHKNHVTAFNGLVRLQRPLWASVLDNDEDSPVSKTAVR